MHTITIDDETFQQLEIEANARNLPIADWLRSAHPRSERKPAKDLTTEEFLERMREFEASLKPLNPNADFSRDAIYE